MPEDDDWRLEALRRWEGPLLRYARSLTGDDEAARDLVQDCFLRLCRQSRRKVEERLPAWLYTVCRNRAIDLRRKRRPVAWTDLDATPVTGPSPGAPLERAEAAARTRRCLAQLSEREQELLRLKFEHGLSYRSMADITGLSSGNVGFVLHHALRRLRELLERAATDTRPEVLP